jgi:gamma-D-glutamyl-L-lysine dipeptidyl-peptidase
MTQSGTVHLSAIPMRAEASDASEMVNQILFGETFSLLEQHEKWSKVRLHHDGYEGWICNKQWFEIQEDSLKSCLICQNQGAKIKTDVGVQPIPTGARIWNYKKGKGGCKNARYSIKSAELVPLNSKTKTKKLIQTALVFLRAPYLWGGRTIAGIDCSGLVQVVYSVHGCQLPRDASQQASLGLDIPLELASTGDLAFFSNQDGRITHVGIIESPLKKSKKRIIHASGFVRRDYLDQNGIYLEDKKEGREYSHHLHSIRRVIDPKS